MVTMVMVYTLTLGMMVAVCAPAASQTTSGSSSPSTTPSPESPSLSTTRRSVESSSASTSPASSPSADVNGSVGSMPDAICNATHKDICAEQLNSKLEKVKCVMEMCRCADNHVFDNNTCLPFCRDPPKSSILRWVKKIFSAPEKCTTRMPCSAAICAAKLNSEIEKVKCDTYDNCICAEPYKLVDDTCKLSENGDDLPPNKMATSPEAEPETSGSMTTASTKRTEPDEESVKEISKTGAESEPHLKSVEMENPLTTMEQPSAGVQSTTMDQTSTTKQTTTTLGEPSTTRQTTMAEPSTMGHTTMSQTSTMGQSSTMTTTAPTNEDIKEAAPSNVDLVDAPKPESTDKNSMQGDQPAEELTAKPTVKASTAGEVAGGATAESAPVPRAAAVGAPTPAPTTAPTPAPAPTTSTPVAPRSASEPKPRVPAPPTAHSHRAHHQLGGGENGASTLMAPIFVLCLGLFSTIQLPSYT